MGKYINIIQYYHGFNIGEVKKYAKEVLNINIQKWYIKAHPYDESGIEINPNATFEGLFDTLDCGADVYEFIGVRDCVVRAILLEKLAELMEVDYNCFNNQWHREMKIKQL